MGADSFVAFYGIKIPLDADDEEVLDACGDESDERCVRARAAGLACHSGRMTDGEDHFLLVGRQLAWLGVEHDPYATQSMGALNEVASDVAARLRAAGFSEAPALHLQFCGQY